MKIIRLGTFETNSSSTHSITMCMKEEYEKWKSGELFFVRAENKFIDKEEEQNMLKKAVIYNKIKKNYEEKNMTYKDITVSFDSYEDMYNKTEIFFTKENLEEITNEELKSFREENFDPYDFPITEEEYLENIEDYYFYQNEITTPKGEEVVAFGFYGNDY